MRSRRVNTESEGSEGLQREREREAFLNSAPYLTSSLSLIPRVSFIRYH